MKFFLLLPYCSLCSLLLPAQIQTGLVREINSGRKPVSDVQISFADAVPTTSDGNGVFRLRFSGKHPGDFISFSEIQKDGFELVNGKELEILNFSSSGRLSTDIIVAKKGVTDAAKKEYYNVSDSALSTNFNREKAKLNARLKKAELSQKEYERQITNLQLQYDINLKISDDLAERLARSNFDDFDSIYKSALLSFKNGNIDSAISKLEAASLIKKFQAVVDEQNRILKVRGGNFEAIKTLARLYTISLNSKKADSLFEQSLLLDSGNLSVLEEYAKFSLELHNYDKALQLYTKIETNDNSQIWRVGNAISSIGEIFQEVGMLNNALDKYLAFSEIYRKLVEIKPASDFYKGNLAISFQKLGLTYYQLGNLNMALKFHDLCRILANELTALYPNNGNYKNILAIAYEHLALVYSSLGELEPSLEFYRKSNELMRALLQAYPLNLTMVENVAISFQHLGDSYIAFGEFTKALDYYKCGNLLQKKLFEDNPLVATFKSGLAIFCRKIGSAYGLLSDREQSLVFFEQSNQLQKELVNRYPSDIKYKNDLAKSYQSLGVTNRLLKNIDKALQYLVEYNQIEKTLFERFQENSEFKNELSQSYRLLAEIYIDKKSSYNNVNQLIDTGLLLAKELCEKFTKNVFYIQDLASFYSLKAYFNGFWGKVDSVRFYNEKDLDITLQLHLISPRNKNYSYKLQGLYGLIADSYFEMKQYKTCFELSAKRVEICFEAFNHLPNSELWKKEITNADGSTSFYALFAGKFATAEQLALNGITNDSTANWIYTNLALAYLCQGKWDKAKEIYLRLKDQQNGNQTFKEAFLKDLNDLEEAGITHPDMVNARKLLESTY